MNGIHSEFLELAASRTSAWSEYNRGSRLRAADARAQHKQKPAKPLHSGDLTG